MELAPVCIFVAAVLLTPQPWQTAVIQALLRELSLPVILSACIPFLALATIAEAGCSARFGMEELELSSRFSLQAVLCARLGILNGENLLLLGALMPFGTHFWDAGINTLVSVFFLTANTAGFLDRAADTPALIPAVLLFFETAAVLELRKYIRQSEELTWNFTLTGCASTIRIKSLQTESHFHLRREFTACRAPMEPEKRLFCA